MIIRIKIIPSSRSEWLGWFGNEMIKVRLKTEKDNYIEALLKLFYEDLGIKSESVKVLNSNRNIIQIELPDIAWELLLSVVK